MLGCSAYGRVNERRRPTTTSAGSNKREACHRKRRRERKPSRMCEAGEEDERVEGRCCLDARLERSIRGNIVSKRCLMFLPLMRFTLLLADAFSPPAPNSERPGLQVCGGCKREYTGR